MHLSKRCFTFHFTSLLLDVVWPIFPPMCTKVVRKKLHFISSHDFCGTVYVTGAVSLAISVSWWQQYTPKCEYVPCMKSKITIPESMGTFTSRADANIRFPIASGANAILTWPNKQIAFARPASSFRKAQLIWVGRLLVSGASAPTLTQMSAAGPRRELANKPSILEILWANVAMLLNTKCRH